MTMNKSFYYRWVMKFVFIIALFFSIIGCESNNKKTYTGKILSFESKLDTSYILIGDQLHYKIILIQPKSAKLAIPVFKDKLTDKIEILGAQFDTISLNDSLIKISHDYLITSFDSGIHEIPAIAIRLNLFGTSDSLYSPSDLLHVNVPPTKIDKIHDIKSVMSIPIGWNEILPYILYIGGGLVLLTIIILIILFASKKKNVIKIFEKSKDPAHVIAIRELEKLKESKLWQQGNIKEYYSRLTDIVRIYIEGRFGTLAMEQTSEEICTEMILNKTIDEKLISKLRKFLYEADMVKFAKAQPLPDENENAWLTANDFVKETKPNDVIEIEAKTNKV